VLVKSVKFQGFNCTKPVIRYDEDFFYVEKDVEVIEDMKGVLTTEFTLKRHLMKALLGLEVRVVSDPGSSPILWQGRPPGWPAQAAHHIRHRKAGVGNL
jgi:hypothetical protein